MGFKLYPVKNVTTSNTTVLAAAADTTIIGLSFANTTASGIKVSAFVTRSAVDYYIVKDADIAAGGALVAVGGDQKIVLNSGDTLKAISNTATSADALLSCLE